jgi:hypothetical protein
MLIFRNHGYQFYNCSKNMEKVSQEAYTSSLKQLTNGNGSAACPMPCKTTRIFLKKIFEANVETEARKCPAKEIIFRLPQNVKVPYFLQCQCCIFIILLKNHNISIYKGYQHHLHIHILDIRLRIWKLVWTFLRYPECIIKYYE